MRLCFIGEAHRSKIHLKLNWCVRHVALVKPLPLRFHGRWRSPTQPDGHRSDLPTTSIVIENVVIWCKRTLTPDATGIGATAPPSPTKPLPAVRRFSERRGTSIGQGAEVRFPTDSLGTVQLSAPRHA